MLYVQLRKKLSHFTLDVDFQVGNETVILFGPSGSGKTTILNCIAGLDAPDQGKIELNKVVLTKDKQLITSTPKRQVGYVFQDYALFPHKTILENIKYGSSDDSLINHLLTILKIDHLRSQYPHQISGGEKQRLALARALAAKPDVLLLDEPFSSLDERTKYECHSELLRLKQEWNIPIILVTHDSKEAEQLGDRILSIEKGKLE
ncbi:ABC transporter [Halobacillus andaensis]|uniref:ABC transporter n=1 Tax=Halobacillus andaensis TaxID=1176239 RepID=A0A917B2N1_HALAA|nr:ATP-binding cassette domain-containing protein [Halobacillus andaensis]MBP2005021.1 molybdate transport system ATP-binding protein [Halobacillus andaensis]GGF17149.1 ABC transporter [Halobacillus andaensis]